MYIRARGPKTVPFDRGGCPAGGTAVARANPQARSYLGTNPVGGSIGAVLDRLDATSLDDLPTRFQRQGRNYRVKSSDVRG
ncbi:hypothetical protein BRC63_01455 [Halobacteriales archaeon QH_10_70_21]|nr:MAG: hypothetical protein BRC63_01455 [Halobacteriales archaeon QH_10_70_21]